MSDSSQFSPTLSLEKTGIITGKDIDLVFADAQRQGYALPAVNVVGTNSANAVLESAKKYSSPLFVQVSQSGAAFFAGKSLDNANQKASIAGALSLRDHVERMSKELEISVMMHTDHCARELLPWVDGLLDAGEAHFAKTGAPLFSSHMLDLSAESLEKNIETCKQYLARTHKLDMYLELEIGITGGEEDGVDNSSAAREKLYSSSEDVLYAYKELSAVSDRFLLAVAFGNVHGVYKPGNVTLQPKILKDAQAAVQRVHETSEKPVKLVFHGGSGSTDAEITEAVSYGAVKFNVDTDIQWAFTNGVRIYIDDKHGYLESQIGNPENPDAPNKKYYDPRSWLRAGEMGIIDRLAKLTTVLGSRERIVFKNN